VKSAVERALETEARPSLTLDSRLTLVFGRDKSLPDIVRLMQTFGSYISASEYQAPTTES
jgi:hypothetical protein